MGFDKIADIVPIMNSKKILTYAVKIFNHEDALLLLGL
jgi:hypothetical protein